MDTLENTLQAAWDGWRLKLDGRYIGHVEARSANGFDLVLDEGNPPIGWTETRAESVTEAMSLLEDYCAALVDTVELGDNQFDNGQFAAAPVVWKPYTR